MPWITLSPDVLQGRGLAAYPAGSVGNLFDWAENPQAQSWHSMPHAGDFLVDIVRIEANAVHQPSKPDDEILLVLDGILELTDDGSGKIQAFAAGDIAFIPKGWAGIYRCKPNERPFLELAIVPHDYFDPSPPDPSGASPQRIELPVVPGAHEFHRGRFVVAAQGTGAAWRGSFKRDADEIVLVRTGQLTIAAGGARESFTVGSVVVLPRGLAGDVEASADYQALALSWIA